MPQPWSTRLPAYNWSPWLAASVFRDLLLGRHLGFPEFRNLAFLCVNGSFPLPWFLYYWLAAIFVHYCIFWHTVYCHNNFRLKICSLGQVLAAFVIFLLWLARPPSPIFKSIFVHFFRVLGRHLDFQQFRMFASCCVQCPTSYYICNSQVDIFSFSEVLAVLLILLLSCFPIIPHFWIPLR